MGKSQRDKGKRGEREVATLLRDAGFPGVRRGWQSRAGSDEPDVIGLQGFWVEVGFGRTIRPRTKLLQAVVASNERGGVPVAVTRGADRGDDWIATMRFSDFLEMVKRLEAKAP